MYTFFIAIEGKKNTIHYYQRWRSDNCLSSECGEGKRVNGKGNKKYSNGRNENDGEIEGVMEIEMKWLNLALNSNIC